MILTPRQKKILNLIKDSEFVNVEFFNDFFANPTYRKEMIERFIRAGYLLDNGMIGRLKVNKEKIYIFLGLIV